MEKITERLSTDYFIYPVCAERFYYVDEKPRIKVYYSFLRQCDPIYSMVDEYGNFLFEISKTDFESWLDNAKAS